LTTAQRMTGVLSATGKPRAGAFKPGRSMVIVTWMRGEGQKWCALADLTPLETAGLGVYIVWYAGNPGRVVCVGQGRIADELARLRADDEVIGFAANGPLLVTWAPVSDKRLDGIERYLADTWPPLLDRPRPQVPAIEVNSPAWLRRFV